MLWPTNPAKIGADGDARLYADESGEYLAFKVADDRLVTRLAAAEVIRDMVSVAQHRQWAPLTSVAPWNSGVRRGLRPARAAWWYGAISRANSTGRRSPTGRKSGTVRIRAVWKQRLVRFLTKMERTERLDYDKGVSGRLIEVGQAPYRNRNNAEKTAYVAIELDSGRQHKVWGVGLEKAIADGDAKPGDRIQVRRDGVEQVTKKIKVIDAANGHTHVRAAASSA